MIDGVAEMYGSHLPFLLRAVLCTDGPILELGAGRFSTPLLHTICAATHRRLVTFENDRKWATRFEPLIRGNEYHALKVFSDIGRLSELTQSPEWSLVFVDHGPGSRRRVDLQYLSASDALVLVHDTEDPQYDFDFSVFEHRVDYKPTSGLPWTTAASNRPIPEALVEMCQ